MDSQQQTFASWFDLGIEGNNMRGLAALHETAHPQIHIHDVPPYDISIFNYAATTGHPMITADIWSEIHPSLVTLPCDWGGDYSVPYGLLYAKEPAAHVREFVEPTASIPGRWTSSTATTKASSWPRSSWTAKTMLSTDPTGWDKRSPATRAITTPG